MADIVKPTDLEFAEFTAVLVLETFRAVITAQLQQEREVRELEAMAALEIAEYAESFISDDAVRDELLHLFPVEGKANVSAVDEKFPYQPEEKERIESPPVFRLTGYAMRKKEDYEKGEEGFLITRRGYHHIFETVRINLALQEKKGVSSLIRGGVPRVVVDHGRVNTKMTFALQEQAQLPEKEMKVGRGLAKFAKPAFPFKFMVRPVNNRSPEFLTLNVNVVGEVEVTFKTISG
jgi:hypothetical protein